MGRLENPKLHPQDQTFGDRICFQYCRQERRMQVHTIFHYLLRLQEESISPCRAHRNRGRPLSEVQGPADTGSNFPNEWAADNPINAP